MIPARRRSRSRWIALLCALAAIPVVVVGIRQGVRHVRETRAIEALRSKDPRERKSALDELEKLQSVRAVPSIVSSLATRGEVWISSDPDFNFHAEPGDRSRFDTSEEIDESWEVLCGLAVRRIGADSVPLLRSKLSSPEARERFYALRFLWRLPELAGEGPGPAAFSLLEDPDERVRDEAAMALGSEAATNPNLLQRLAACLEREGASEVLRIAAASGIATAAVGPRVFGNGLFKSTEEETSAPLNTVSPEEAAVRRSAALVLLESLDDPSSHVRLTCLHGACKFLKLESSTRSEIREAVQGILRRWLMERDATNRLLALPWLGVAFESNAGSKDLPQDILDILGGLLGDSDSQVRSQARAYLKRPEAVPVLMRFIEEGGDFTASREALDILESLIGVEAWSALFAVLERPDGSVRWVVADLLSSMGEKEGLGIIRLSQAIESRSPEVRRAAARVLARYHASGSLEPRGLFALLHDADEAVLVEAAVALSESGNLDAEDFEHRVLRLIDPSRPRAVREAACRAASGLGPRAESAVPRLVLLLEEKSRDGLEAAAAALGAIGPGARAGVPALIAAAKGMDLDLAAEAVEALVRISPADTISPAVVALARDSARLRDAAQAALWSLGSDARPALPGLRELAAQEKDLDLATRATTLVGRIQVLEASR